MVGDDVFPFLEVQGKEVRKLDTDTLFAEIGGDVAPEGLLPSDDPRQAALVADICKVARVCQTHKRNIDLITVLNRFRQTYGPEATAELKEALNQKLL